MSANRIAQPVMFNISLRFTDYFVTWDRSQWVNGRPVLLNGDVWCPMCETWHANHTLCQQ